jgi:hypothetical protein
MKSIAHLDLILTAALGEATGFGAERFGLGRPLRSAYITEEDRERLLRRRLAWLLARRGLSSLPPGLLIESRRGLSPGKSFVANVFVSEERAWVL